MRKVPKAVSAYFSKIGRRGGKKGGDARSAALTPERRQEIARHAVAVREAKRAERARLAGQA